MSGPQRAKVYRNVELRQQWLGLEPFDALALGFLLWLLMLLDRQALGWNLLVIVIGYVALRIGKRGKPTGLTTAFIKFYLLRKPFFSAGAPDAEVAEHPFPFDLGRGASVALQPSAPRTPACSAGACPASRADDAINATKGERR